VGAQHSAAGGGDTAEHIEEDGAKDPASLILHRSRPRCSVHEQVKTLALLSLARSVERPA
jgi:hypothetical protein